MKTNKGLKIMTKKSLIETLKAKGFYRFYCNKLDNEIIKEKITEHLKTYEGKTPLFKVTETKSNYKFRYTSDYETFFNCQLTDCDINEIRKNQFLVSFYYLNENNEKVITSKVLYIIA